MEDIYKYKEHKLWWWMFELSVALNKGGKKEEEGLQEAFDIVEDVMNDDQAIWPDKLINSRGSSLW